MKTEHSLLPGQQITVNGPATIKFTGASLHSEGAGAVQYVAAIEIEQPAPELPELEPTEAAEAFDAATD